MIAERAGRLFARASEAWQQGRHEAATQLLETLVEQQPRHVAALNTLAMIALNRGDAGAAIAYLERAAAAEPGAAPIWFNLFQALELAGDLERGAGEPRSRAGDRSLLPARHPDEGGAAGAARTAAGIAGASSARSSPPARAPTACRSRSAQALAHGRRAGPRRRRAPRRRAASGPLAEVRAAYPGADFDRAEAYAEQRTGRRKVYVQQPVGGHFPYLPAIEFFPRDHFPWLAALEAKTAEIRRELLSLLDERRRRLPALCRLRSDPAGQPMGRAQPQPALERLVLLGGRGRGRTRIAPAARRPPPLLEALPLLDLPGKGPTAMFSILEPRTRIPPHTGSSNVRTTVHLPLVVPEGCGFRVGAETRTFEAGKAWAFDDTIEHEAWNDSDEPRAILILDVWNPLLSEAERAAVRVVG